MFTTRDGEIELPFRGEPHRASAGSTVNIPANAPHSFKNKSDKPARLVCMCTPAGQEELFMAGGRPRAIRPRPPPKLTQTHPAHPNPPAPPPSPKSHTQPFVVLPPPPGPS